MAPQPSIAIIGAGMGGLAAAATLRAIGAEVTVYEQASRFARVGAGIQLSPNAFRVVHGLGLGPRIQSIAFRPPSWMNREWDTGEKRFDFLLGDAAEARYGAPYYQLHRGDLHAALLSAVPGEAIRLGKRLDGIEPEGARVRLTFADGSAVLVDAVVGADGVHSRVREIMHGPEQPDFTGRVAYRTTYPAARLNGVPTDENTKWWGPDRHIVIYYVTPRKDEIYFVTSVPEPEWQRESWSAEGDVRVVREKFAGFHEQVQRVLAACPSVHKWALADRRPLSRWSDGPVVLIGDACHPLTPYMAQGAAMALEDAAVLARLVQATPDDLPRAFRRFQATREARTAQMQDISHRNAWMDTETEADWVYGYDAWSVPLAEA